MIKTSNEFVQVKSIKIAQLKEKIKVYNLNVLGYHTYVVSNELLVVHNEGVDIKQGATKKVQYNYNGKKIGAYNTGGGKTFYAVDRAEQSMVEVHLRDLK